MEKFETTEYVFLDDLDAIGILHNSRHLSFFDRALGSFWRHLGWRGSLVYEKFPDLLQVVRENRVEYLRPVSAVDEVRIISYVTKLGRTSISFRFLMLPLNEDLPYSRGTKVMVKIDPKTMKPSPFSEEFRQMISPWVHKESW